MGEDHSSCDVINRPLYGGGCTDPKQSGGILAPAFPQHRCGSAVGLHKGSPEHGQALAKIAGVSR